jgi:hypothetical protein
MPNKAQTSERSASAQVQPDAPVRARYGQIVQRALADPASVRRADIPILQRTLGNQAVGRLLSPLQPPPGVPSPKATTPLPIHSRYLNQERPVQQAPITFQKERIQRALILHKPKVLNTEVEKEGQRKARIVDGAVETAFSEFKKGDLAGASDAQKALYLMRKRQYDQGDKGMHPSTAAGYIIEGKVNNKLTKHAGEGFDLQDAHLLKGTRPDIVFSLPGDQKGLVDITASNSVGHIFKKKGNWTNHVNIPYVAESIYTSIDFSDPSSTSPLTPEQIEEAIKRGQESEEWKAYVEQEMAAREERKFDTWQEEVVRSFNDYVEEARFSDRSPYWRINRREQGVWDAIGLEVEIDESEEIWRILRRDSYETWKSKYPSSLVNDLAFERVLNQIANKKQSKTGETRTFGQSLSGRTSGVIRNRDTRKKNRYEPYPTDRRPSRKFK